MPQTKRNSGLAQSAKQRQNFCYGPPPVYQDVSTRQDWPVNKAIAHLPVRLKGKSKHISGNSLSPLGAQNKDIGAASQTLLTGVRLLCDAGNKWLWRAAELCVLLETSVVTVRFECTCYSCSESYSRTVHCNVNRKFAMKIIQYPTTASNVCWYSRIIPILQTLSFSKFPIIPTRHNFYAVSCSPAFDKCRYHFHLDVGARNHRRFCAVNYNKTPGFEVSSDILGITSYLLRKFGLPLRF